MDVLLNSIVCIIGSVIVVWAYRVIRYLQANFENEPVSQKELVKLHCKNEAKILAEVPALSNYSNPPRFWGSNGHLQTFYHIALRSSPPMNFTRIMIDSKDIYSKVAIDIESRFINHSKKEIPTIIIVPGIAGSSKQHYVRNFVNACTQKGWRSVVLNHRGCNSDISHPSIFTVGNTGDLRSIFEYVHHTYPGSPVFAAGCSMGANVLIKYVGEYHNHQNNNFKKNNTKYSIEKSSGKVCDENLEFIPLHGVISISQGYHLLTTADFLPKKRKLYDYGLNLKYLAILKKNRSLFEKVENIVLNKVLKTKSMLEFDEMYTCKIHNFENVYKYYEDHCCSTYLPKIDVPTLLINALDDPIIPEYQVNKIHDVCKTNEKLTLVTTRYGGHLAFVEPESFFDIIPKRECWMDRVSVEYIDSILKKQTQ